MFFGSEYKVLRGGSFAVDPVACRGTFRNWDYPIRRQIFSGFPHRPLGGGLMCRHLAYLGPEEPLGRVLVEPPHSLFRQSWAPRRQRYGTVNADGFGVGWYAPRGSRPGALPAGRADLGRPVLRRPGPGGAFGCRARGRPGRDARRGGRRGRGGAVRGRAVAVQPQRRGRGLAGRGGTAGVHAAAGRPALAPGPHRLGVRLGAGPAPAARRGRPRAGPGRSGPPAGTGRPRLPAEPAADRRSHDHRHHLGRLAVVPHGARPRHGRRLRAVRRRSAVAGRSPTAPCSPRAAPACCSPRWRNRRPHHRRSPAVEPPARHPHPPRGRHGRRAARRASLHGLTVTPKWLPPKWFYDARGSELFRADHGTARVLPHPCRTGDPRHPVRRDRRRERRPAPWSNWARAPRRRPAI